MSEWVIIEKSESNWDWDKKWESLAVTTKKVWLCYATVITKIHIVSW